MIVSKVMMIELSQYYKKLPIYGCMWLWKESNLYKTSTLKIYLSWNHNAYLFLDYKDDYFVNEKKKFILRRDRTF